MTSFQLDLIHLRRLCATPYQHRIVTAAFNMGEPPHALVALVDAGYCLDRASDAEPR